MGALAGLALALMPMILLGAGFGIVFGVGAVIAVAVWWAVRAARGPNRRAFFFSAVGGMVLGAVTSPIVLFVLAEYTGCDPGCECPVLVEVVASIDWAPGVSGRQTNASASERPTRRGVSYQFDVDDAAGHVTRLRLVFEEAGWEVEPYRPTGDRETGFKVAGPGYAVFVREGGSFLPRAEETFTVSVSIIDGGPDAQAAAVLGPVVEAVGLR